MSLVVKQVNSGPGTFLIAVYICIYMYVYIYIYINIFIY